MNEKLQETLQALRKEIDKLKPDETESKDRLEQLIRKLELKLDRPDDTNRHLSLTEGLSDSLTYFEVSHPRITGVLNDLMMTLSNMGI